MFDSGRNLVDLTLMFSMLPIFGIILVVGPCIQIFNRYYIYSYFQILSRIIGLEFLLFFCDFDMMAAYRDGEVVNISSYPNCSGESCHCRSSIASENLNCSAVTLRIWKGLYHERYGDIVKVLSTVTIDLFKNVKFPVSLTVKYFHLWLTSPY